MEQFESAVSIEQSIELIGARINRRKALVSAGRRVRRAAALQDSPTKDLDALMLGNALVGYGANMSLTNMAIMENLMTMAIMEANFEVPGGKNTLAWYDAFIRCLHDLGCFVADDGYTRYSESSQRVDMDFVISDIVKGIIDGVKASVPAASVLGTVVNTTIDGLKQDKQTLNLYNSQVKTPEGARLSVIPCEQLANGILIASSASIRQTGTSNNGGVLFVNWQSSAREIFRGKSFVTFNPARYEEFRSDIEEYLGEHRREVLRKRFNRRKQG
ncbi:MULTISPECIES: hypothetical protein [unclassified Pseudomonas]|uniref:hypothetical protein n=1 Tax=unclassified Pseudomonas TaxID=196821 RepID=UPI00119AC6E8|nr:MULTISPECIES: hypothetical protein [unclassified Pseudomonas]TWC15774.1 hypothetical protein FBY00_11314 [Pseudomonas sp. SJZ075]TWC23991.1 hypothetical protein FBX99_10358 [Pseudomonas sp. SJZ074]TWC31904.1 hypothetical protein FBY02_113105 [Pseudomonas sp. SJZ078]TWC41730.1 hypothetical protein FBY06_10258 [Pseudomonas sp. SJZ085]TWC45822.1 hypothetical protein FBY11_14713 [Pseudomonas sp. SJZ124]